MRPTSSFEADRSGLSRRQFTQYAAWSVPVVVVATAVPARAASTDDQALTYDFATRSVGTVEGTPVLTAVPVTVTIENNVADPIPAGTLIRITVVDYTAGNPTPGLQVTGMTGPVGPGAGPLPSNEYEAPLLGAVPGNGSAIVGLLLALGSGTFNDGTVRSWAVSTTMMGDRAASTGYVVSSDWTGVIE